MKRTFSSSGLLFTIVAILLAYYPVRLEGQVQGNNAVYTGTTTVSGSAAFIDAATFAGTSSTDFCVALNDALYKIPSSAGAAVVDARGLNSANTSMSCANSPWTSPNTITLPSTVLLPAGTITISSSWVLPNGTRIVGEGSGATNGSITGSVTTVQAASNTVNPMIQMGTSTGSLACPSAGCTGVGVEDLFLNGGTFNISGISNANSQERSYVKHVTLYQFTGAGLLVSSGAENSGPYADITFGLASPATPHIATICAQILEVSTRGIHGLTCTNTSTSTIPIAAVYLDGPNNSIEDVTVQGFKNGIQVGANASAQSNVIFNVQIVDGNTTQNNAVVHIENVSGNTVDDLSIMGVSKGGAPYTIDDEHASPALKIADATVGVYVLGDPVTANGSTIGYSLFSTSLSVPSWIVQTSTSTPAGTCIPGTLLSNPAGTAGSTWYLCTPSGWSNLQ